MNSACKVRALPLICEHLKLPYTMPDNCCLGSNSLVAPGFRLVQRQERIDWHYGTSSWLNKLPLKLAKYALNLRPLLSL